VRVEATLAAWLDAQRRDNPVVVAVERDPDPALRRWYLRMRGEERDYIAVWFTLGDYTLAYEAYVMPAPEENAGELYEYLLRRNTRMNGMAFAIGAEDAVYVRGQLPLHAVDDGELDRIVGSAYAYVEQWFRPAMRIGFRSRFRD
jgi:putative sensory transduction regulator